MKPRFLLAFAGLCAALLLAGCGTRVSGQAGTGQKPSIGVFIPLIGGGGGGGGGGKG